MAEELYPPLEKAWKDAVLHECMMTEACYIESDATQTVRNLINWHVLNERFHNTGDVLR